jgi:hypothetical protein
MASWASQRPTGHAMARCGADRHGAESLPDANWSTGNPLSRYRGTGTVEENSLGEGHMETHVVAPTHKKHWQGAA